MLRNQSFETQSIEVAQTTNGTSVNLDGAVSVAVACSSTVTTPSAANFLAGESEVTTLTFPAKADATAGDYFVVYDSAGNAWAASLDKTGTDEEPTGAIWSAITAGRKVHVDISGTTDAASVAAAVELAFDALTAVPFTTDDSAADGTMLVTCTIRGNTTDAVVKNEDDSGAGSISEAQTNQGVASTIDVDANTITIASHDFSSGLKGQLTTTGTLPAGLALATDYFVIVVDSDTIKLASSLNNANDGTAINITNQGSDSGTHTFTATSLAGASVKLQCSLDESVWFDISGATATITGNEDNLLLEKIDPTYRFIRAVHTITAGQLSQSTTFLTKANS
jgi:hypothetical protein